MLSPTELDQIDRDGFATVDTTLTPAEVAAASAAMDRAFEQQGEGFSGDLFDPDIVHVLQHPWLERAAKEMLRAGAVRLRAVAMRKTKPRPGGDGLLEGEHADVRYSTADLDGTPKRMLCTILVWLSDVTPTRAPFVFRPGSHRQLAADFAGDARVDAFHLPALPKLTYAEPVPVLARAGQASVGTTSVIHSGSANTDTEPRRVIFTQFQAKGVTPVAFPEPTQKSMDDWGTKARPIFDASRRHLLDE